MKLVVDLENLDGHVQDTLNDSVSTIIRDTIKSSVVTEVDKQLKEIIREEVGTMIASYVKDYITTTVITIGGGFYDKSEREELTVEQYLKKEIGDIMNSQSLRIKDFRGDVRNYTFEEFIKKEFDMGNAIQETLSNFMDEVKTEINLKLKNQFDDVTRQALSESVLMLLNQNETFTKIQTNIASLSNK